jgi:hypothetical protein
MYAQMQNGQEQMISNISGANGFVGLSYEFEFDTPDPRPGAIP